jgi:hypothetical protein
MREDAVEINTLSAELIDLNGRMKTASSRFVIKELEDSYKDVNHAMTVLRHRRLRFHTDIDEIVCKICDDIKQRSLATMIWSKATLITLLSRRRSNKRELRRKMYLLLRRKTRLFAQLLSLRRKNLLSQLLLRTHQYRTRMLLPRQGQLNQCLWHHLLELIFPRKDLLLRKVKFLALSPKLLRLMKLQKSRFQWNNLNLLQYMIRPQCLKWMTLPCCLLPQQHPLLQPLLRLHSS